MIASLFTKGKLFKHIIVFVGWLFFGAAMFYYVIQVAQQYESYDGTPGVVLSYFSETPLYYPSVTICNWNTGFSCPTCGLELLSCDWINQESTQFETCPFPVKKLIIGDDTSTAFTCYRLNDDTDSPLIATKTGYLGTISLSFKIPIDFANANMQRAGLQVSFHPIGEEPDLIAETNYATMGRDNAFTVRKVVHKILKPSVNQSSVDVYWESSYSPLQSVQGLTESDTDFKSKIDISIAYNILNVKQYEEVSLIDIWQTIGQASSYINMLLGLDATKLVRTILVIPRIFLKKVTPYELWDTIN